VIASLALLAAQVSLSPCAIEGVRPPVHCGTYRVWENRETRQGRQIDLHVIVLDAFASAKKPDPMFFFAGGPGDAPSFNARFFSRVFEGVRASRDLVLVDLRGTGKSSPLWCPELDTPDASGVFDPDEMSAPAVRACRARLEQEIDLRQYTTEIVVDDLDDVRRALGYSRINVYGTSYGSRVAQVYMRRHPESLRVVTMKGIVPSSMAAPEDHAREGERAWQRLVARCKADGNCARTYPTLDADFRALLARIDNPPRVMTLPASAERPELRIKVTSGLFAEGFRNVLYSPDTAAQAPKLITSLLKGDERGLTETALSARRLLGGERLSAGFFLSVSCTEDVPYLPKDWAPLVAGSFGGDYRLRQQTAACVEWPRGKVSPQHRQPTRSDIPTLIFSGEFDPVTPPSGGEAVMTGLTHGRHVIVRNNGHPIGSAEACIGSIIAAAVDKGSVDGLDQSCAAAIPAPPFLLVGKDK
jgi:pimeloyl-ACP methyl ester carboxylesterase